MLSSGCEGFRLKGPDWLSGSAPWLRGSFGESGGGTLVVPPFIYDVVERVAVEKVVVVDSGGDSFFSKRTKR